MNLHRHIDLYCERVDASFWAEPLNAISNLAFILVGLFVFGLAQRNKADLFTKSFCLGLVAIGIGSFLFHTFANVWSILADIFPIQLFIITYTYFVFSRFIGLVWWVSVLKTVSTLVVLAFLIRLLPQGMHEWTNGSLSYAPAFLLLIGLGTYLAASRQPAAKTLLLAAGLFFISLTLRSIDEQVCDKLPIGVHYLWHVLNSCVLGVLCLGAIRYGQWHQLANRKPNLLENWWPIRRFFK